jgi:hypothetical protein
MAQTNNPDKPERQDRFEDLHDRYEGAGVDHLERRFIRHMGLKIPEIVRNLDEMQPGDLDKDELKEIAIDAAGAAALTLVVAASDFPDMLLDKDGNGIITITESVEFIHLFKEKLDGIRQPMVEAARLEMYQGAMMAMTKQETISTYRSELGKLQSGEDLTEEDREAIEKFISEEVIKPLLPDVPDTAEVFRDAPDSHVAYLEYKKAQRALELVGEYMVKVLEDYGDISFKVGDERKNKAHFVVEAMLDFYESGHGRGGGMLSETSMGTFNRPERTSESSIVLLAEFTADIAVKIAEDAKSEEKLVEVFEDIGTGLRLSKYLTGETSPYTGLLDMFGLVGANSINLAGGERGPIPLLSHVLEHGDLDAINAEIASGLEEGEQGWWEAAKEVGGEAIEWTTGAVTGMMSAVDEKTERYGGYGGIIRDGFPDIRREIVLDAALWRSGNTREEVLQTLAEEHTELGVFFEEMFEMEPDAAVARFQTLRRDKQMMDASAKKIWDPRGWPRKTWDWAFKDDFKPEWYEMTVEESLIFLGLGNDEDIRRTVSAVRDSNMDFVVEFNGENIARKIWGLRVKDKKKEGKWQRQVVDAASVWAQDQVDGMDPYSTVWGRVKSATWQAIPPVAGLSSIPFGGTLAFANWGPKTMGAYVGLDMFFDLKRYYRDYKEKGRREGRSVITNNPGTFFVEAGLGVGEEGWGILGDQLWRGDWPVNAWIWNGIAGKNPLSAMVLADKLWKGSTATITATDKFLKGIPLLKYARVITWPADKIAGILGSAGGGLKNVGAIQLITNKAPWLEKARIGFTPISIYMSYRIMKYDIIYDYTWNPATLQFEPSGDNILTDVERLDDVLLFLLNLVWGVEGTADYLASSERRLGKRWVLDKEGRVYRGMKVVSRKLGTVGERMGMERAEVNKTPFKDLGLNHKRLVLDASGEGGELKGSLGEADRAKAVKSIEITDIKKGAKRGGHRIVIKRDIKYERGSGRSKVIKTGEHIVIQEVSDVIPNEDAKGRDTVSKEVTTRHRIILKDGTILHGDSIGLPDVVDVEITNRGSEIKNGPLEVVKDLRKKVEGKMTEIEKRRGGGEEKYKVSDKFESKHVKQQVSREVGIIGEPNRYTITESTGGKTSSAEITISTDKSGVKTIHYKTGDATRGAKITDPEVITRVAEFFESGSGEFDVRGEVGKTDRGGTKVTQDATLDLIEGKVGRDHIVSRFVEIENIIRGSLGMEPRVLHRPDIVVAPEPVVEEGERAKPAEEPKPAEEEGKPKEEKKDKPKKRRRWRRRGSTPGDAKQKVNLLGEEDLKRGRKAAKDARTAERRAGRIAVDEAIHSPKSEPKPSAPRPVSEPGAPPPMPEPPKGPTGSDGAPTARASEPVRGTASNPVEAPSNVFELRPPEAPKLGAYEEGNLARALPDEVGNKPGGKGGEPPKGPTNSPLELVADNPGLERTPARGEARLAEPAGTPEVAPEPAPEAKEVKSPLDVYKANPDSFVDGVVEQARATHNKRLGFDIMELPSVRQIFENIKANMGEIFKIMEDIKLDAKIAGNAPPKGMTIEQFVKVQAIGHISDVAFAIMYAVGLAVGVYITSKSSAEDADLHTGYDFTAGMVGGFAGFGAAYLGTRLILNPIAQAVVLISFGLYAAMKGAEVSIDYAEARALQDSSLIEKIGQPGIVSMGGPLTQLAIFNLSNSRGDIVNIAKTEVTGADIWSNEWEQVPVYKSEGHWSNAAMLDHGGLITEPSFLTAYAYQLLPGDIEASKKGFEKLFVKLGGEILLAQTQETRDNKAWKATVTEEDLDGDSVLLARCQESQARRKALQKEAEPWRTLLYNGAVTDDKEIIDELYSLSSTLFELQRQQKETFAQMDEARRDWEGVADILAEWDKLETVDGTEYDPEIYQEYLRMEERYKDSLKAYEDLSGQIIEFKNKITDRKNEYHNQYFQGLRDEHVNAAWRVIDMQLEERALTDAISFAWKARANSEVNPHEQTLWQERYEEKLREKKVQDEMMVEFLRSTVRAAGFPERIDDLASRPELYIPNTIEGVIAKYGIEMKNEKLLSKKQEFERLGAFANGNLIDEIVLALREESELAIASYEQAAAEYVQVFINKRPRYEKLLEEARQELKEVEEKRWGLGRGADKESAITSAKGDIEKWAGKIAEIDDLAAGGIPDPDDIAVLQHPVLGEFARATIAATKAFERETISARTPDAIIAKFELRLQFDGQRADDHTEEFQLDYGMKEESSYPENLRFTDGEKRLFEIVQVEMKGLAIEMETLRTDLAHSMSPYIDDSFFWKGDSSSLDIVGSDLDMDGIDDAEQEALIFEQLVIARQGVDIGFDSNEGYDFEEHELGIRFGYESFKSKYNGLGNVPGRAFGERIIAGIQGEELNEQAEQLLTGHEYLVTDAELHVRILDQYGVFENNDQWELDRSELEQLRYEQMGGVDSVREDRELENRQEQFKREIMEDPEAASKFITKDGELDFMAMMEEGLLTMPQAAPSTQAAPSIQEAPEKEEVPPRYTDDEVGALGGR